jgi:hypothetical protein
MRRTTTYVHCKTLGHAWEDDPFSLRRTSFGNSVTFKCIRCTTERVDIFSFHAGDLLARRYHYPDGYRNAEKLTKNELRLELIRQSRAVRKARMEHADL